MSILVLIGTSMRTYLNSTILLATGILAISLFALAWFIAVPAFLTPSSFLMLTGLVAGFGWVAKTTLLNAQADPSLAQTLHDAEVSALDRARKIR